MNINCNELGYINTATENVQSSFLNNPKIICQWGEESKPILSDGAFISAVVNIGLSGVSFGLSKLNTIFPTFKFEINHPLISGFVKTNTSFIYIPGNQFTNQSFSYVIKSTGKKYKKGMFNYKFKVSNWLGISYILSQMYWGGISETINYYKFLNGIGSRVIQTSLDVPVVTAPYAIYRYINPGEFKKPEFNLSDFININIKIKDYMFVLEDVYFAQLAFGGTLKTTDSEFVSLLLDEGYNSESNKFTDYPKYEEVVDNNPVFDLSFPFVEYSLSSDETIKYSSSCPVLVDYDRVEEFYVVRPGYKYYVLNLGILEGIKYVQSVQEIEVTSERI